MYILNTEFFGYIMQDEKYTDTNDAARKFFQYKLETLGEPRSVCYYTCINFMQDLQYEFACGWLGYSSLI